MDSSAQPLSKIHPQSLTAKIHPQAPTEASLGSGLSGGGETRVYNPPSGGLGGSVDIEGRGAWGVDLKGEQQVGRLWAFFISLLFLI